MGLDFIDKEEVLLILNAFRQLYSENKHYNNITLNQISEKSGINIGHIYANFQDKEDIVITLLKKDIHDIFITYDEEVDKSLPIHDRLKIFMSLQFEFLEQDYKLIKDILPYALNPISPFFTFANETRKRFLNFVSELFYEKSVDKNNLIKKATVPIIANSFLVFNLTVLSYWDNDKSVGKQDTLNYIDKGLKNIMVASAMI
ncbi:MAG: helix-turn-helix domain-containing protein [Candidatus Sericytochromatia bacterium]